MESAQWKPILWSELRFVPHGRQREILLCDAQIRVVACGRRFGKSHAAAIEALSYALMGGHVWIVAPTYDLTRPIVNTVDEFLRRLPSSWIRRRRSAPYEVQFRSGGTLMNRTADNPANLQGRGLDLVVVDEAATIRQKEIWSQYLRPTLVDRSGKALLISTPKQMNWFWDLFRQGQEEWESYQAGRLSATRVRSFQYSSYENPYIPASELDDLTQDMSEDEILQEIRAQFIPMGGAVFRNFHRYLRARWQDAPLPGGVYAVGIDVAKENDFTVLAVIDVTTPEVCYIWRTNQMDYEMQAQMLNAELARWHPVSVYVDGTGNSHMCDRLKLDGWNVHRYVFTNRKKLEAATLLSQGIQQEHLLLPDIPVVREEFARYSYNTTPSGMRTVQGMGGHDDVVTAVMLAWLAAYPFVLYRGGRPSAVGERGLPSSRGDSTTSLPMTSIR